MYEDHGHFHEGDAGLDLFIPKDITIPHAARGFFLDLGIQCEMVERQLILRDASFNPQKEGDPDSQTYRDTFVPYLLMPRSSISKTNLRQANSIGLIDAGYRGSIIAAVDNVASVGIGEYSGDNPGWHEHDVLPAPEFVVKGQRLFQIVAMDGAPFSIELVDELSETTRGDGSFGSTNP
jgi:dUTP pyrophosphatase